MVVRRAGTVVKPWYRQFYLRRGDAEWASDRFSAEDYDVRLGSVDGFVFVGTTMYGSPTDVQVEVHDAEPGSRADSDHIVEVSLTGEGPLAILGWGADEPDAIVELPPVACRLRASWFGLAAAEAHPDSDLGGEGPSPERLVLDIWLARKAERRVLRRWGA